MTIPPDEKPDSVTIEFNGGEHHSDCKTRNGHKFMVGIAGGESGFSIQNGCNYDPQASHNYNLERGKTYGIVVTNQVVGSDTISNLYIQNISASESSAQLVLSHTVQGGAQLATQAGNRIGNRIDNIKGGGALITKCVSVS